MLIIKEPGEETMKAQIKKVLIIDDSDDDRLLAKKILEKHGYKVLEASNWLDAISLVENGSIDLVILDLRMPEMDGFELLGIIRKHNNKLELPIIMYTSSTTVSAKDCVSKGSNYFVQKYSDPKILLDKIEEAFSVI